MEMRRVPMIVSRLICALLCIIVCNRCFLQALRISNQNIAVSHTKLNAISKPVTYRSIEVPIVRKKETVEILVDEKNMDVYLELKKLISSGRKAQPDALQELTNQQAAFPVSDWASIELYEEASRLRNLMQSQPKVYRKPRNPYSGIETYINIGTDKQPFLVKSYLAEQINENLSKEQIEEIQQSFEGFTNITKLFDVERRLNKAAKIPELLEEHGYSWQSNQWAQYLKHSFDSRRFTIAHVIMEYYKHTATSPDVIGNGNFRRKPGFIGTMAPAEDDTIATGSHMLPKRILHPWPAVREFPVYVRWAPYHPRTPSINVMMAKNGQFLESLLIRENEDALKPSTPKDPIYAGPGMEARDVARIARYVKEGNSYDPDIQIDHPGLLSDDHGKLPFYNAAHGPTMDILDTLPERDESFWADMLPSYDTSVLYDKQIPKRPVGEVDQLELKEEEELRAQRAQAIFDLLENAPWRQEELQKQAILEENVRMKVQALEEQLGERRVMSVEEMMQTSPEYKAALTTQRRQWIEELRIKVQETESDWQRLSMPIYEILAIPILGDVSQESRTSINVTQQEEEFEENQSPPIVFDDYLLSILKEKSLGDLFEENNKTVIENFKRSLGEEEWSLFSHIAEVRDVLRKLLHIEIKDRPSLSSDRIEDFPKGSLDRQLAEISAWREKEGSIEDDNEWLSSIRDVLGDATRIEVVPPESLTAEQKLSGTASILPPEERQGPFGKSSYDFESPHSWLDWEDDPLPPPVPLHVIPANANPYLESYRNNVTLRYELQHGALKSLLPPEHNPFHRDVEYHAEEAMIKLFHKKDEEEMEIPLGEHYLKTIRRVKVTSERRVLKEFEASLQEIDEKTDNLAYYFDSIRRITRQAVRRRFPTLYENSFELLSEGIGIADGKMPGSATTLRKLKGHSKEQRTEWQRKVFKFFQEELVPRANKVIMKKFIQATAMGYRSFSNDPPSLDSSEIAMPVLTLDPAEEVAKIFSNPNAERDFVKRKREQIIENEKKMMRLIEAVNGQTKSQKEQVEFAVDIGAQIQATARRVQKERKVILSYKISGNDDGPNRGRKSGKTRLPAAEVPPPKIRNEEDSIVGDTMKMVADEMNRVVNLSLE